MSYNGSGTFQINTSGQPVVAGTVISSTAFNALTADLATGLSTAITKDGQTATTARIPFAQGISSTLVTDSSSTTTGSIITAGGVGIAKALYVGTTANVAGVATFSAGTNLLPAITTSGDTNTGIFFPAADTIAFSEGGVESMRIDSSGNVGIGGTPTQKLQVFGATNPRIKLTESGSGVGCNILQESVLSYLIADNGWVHYTNGAERMRIDSSGNLLVGITSARANAGDVQVSKGISFPATQSAQSDANTLDDYEEGTWTPTVANFTVSGTSTLTGTYTKIGRVVYFDLSFANTGTIANGASNLISLPFSGIDLSGMVAMYLSSSSESMTSGKSGVQIYLDTANARFLPGGFTTTSSGQTLIFSGFYRVS